MNTEQVISDEMSTLHIQCGGLSLITAITEKENGEHLESGSYLGKHF